MYNLRKSEKKERKMTHNLRLNLGEIMALFCVCMSELSMAKIEEYKNLSSIINDHAYFI